MSSTNADYSFFDTHCHFDFPPFSGNEVASLSLAATAGVKHILIPAVAAAYFSRILALSHQFPALHAALGLHPLYVADHNDTDLVTLERYLQQQPDNVIAIGEIGLDLYMAEPCFERQCELLTAQLALAQCYQLPVILHSRRTHDRLAQVLRRHDVARKGVVHGFAGSYQQAAAYVAMGYYIGVGGTITYPRANKTRQAIARLPLERLLLETDAPDMPVNGFQGQPNRPERVATVFQVLCELRPESPACIADTLFRNASTLFALPEYGSSAADAAHFSK